MAKNNLPVEDDIEVTPNVPVPEPVVGGLSTVTGGPSGSVAVKSAAPSKGGVGVVGTQQLSEDQTQSILENMQRFVDQRNSGMNQLMSGINKAYAMTKSPHYALEYEKQQDAQDKQTQDYLMQIATMKSALERNKARMAEAYGAPVQQGPGGMFAPVAGAGAGVPTAGAPTTAPIMQVINSLPASMRPGAMDALRSGDLDSIYKAAAEYEIKGKPSDVKMAEFIDNMPEGPQKEFMRRAYQEKAYAPISIFRGSQETKESPPWVTAPLGRGPLVTAAPAAAPSAPAAAPSAPSAAAPSAPAAATPNLPAAGAKLDSQGLPVVVSRAATPIGGGSVEGVKYAYEQAGEQQKIDRESVIKPMRELQQKTLNMPSEIDNAIQILDNTKVGPGTALNKLALETKGIFTNLPKKDLQYLSNLRTLDSLGKKIILANAKGLLPGSFSDSDRNYIDQTGYGISDPKQFIKASLQMQKAAIIANNDLVAYLSRPGNANRIAEAMEDYKASGRGMAILRKNAPEFFQGEKKTEASTKAPGATSSATKANETIIDFKDLNKRKP